MIIATDLDRTLIPNGKQEYDNSMPQFSDLVKKNNITLFYVTGRNIQEIKDGIQEFDMPLPQAAIAEVGTRIYNYDSEFTEDTDWLDLIEQSTTNWDTKAFEEAVLEVPGARLQEEFRQNKFKRSFFVDNVQDGDAIVAEVKEKIATICEDAVIVWSVDETKQLGLLDILPKKATKVEAVEYLRKKFNAEMEDVIYCGDSGNDLLPLTFGYKAIVVKNAIDDVKQAALSQAANKDNIYIAKGTDSLNGYYVSGIIEGLAHFNIL